MYTALLKKSTIIPVITIDDTKLAVPLAKALHQGGLSTIEITLRTPCALDAIYAIANEIPEITLGVGTIVNEQQLDQAKATGAQFFVSPGTTKKLIHAALERDMFFLPGVSTVSEAMLAYACGLTHLKFFPAELSGGTAMLKNFKAVLPEINFCPTGGITQQTAKTYLQCDNVICVGGTWLAPVHLIKEQRWDDITTIAQQSLQAARQK